MDIKLTFLNEIPDPPEPPFTGREWAAWSASKGRSWCTQQVDGDWTAAVVVEPIDNQPAIVEFRLIAHADPETPWSRSAEVRTRPNPPLTAALLDQPWGKFIQAALNQLTDPTHPAWEMEFWDWENHISSAGFDVRGLLKDDTVTDLVPKRGRRPLAAETLAEVAVLYGEAVDRGEQPIKYLVAILGEASHIVSQWVVKARDRGYLTPAPRQGRAGGRPTEKALAIYREDKKK